MHYYVHLIIVQFDIRIELDNRYFQMSPATTAFIIDKISWCLCRKYEIDRCHFKNITIISICSIEELSEDVIRRHELSWDVKIKHLRVWRWNSVISVLEGTGNGEKN